MDNSMSTAALEAELRRLADASGPAAKRAATQMAAVGERGIKIELSRSSHPAGTKTPSRPHVDPPSLVTGRLRASVRRTRIYQTGAARWTAHVAPTTVYARIQELGGWAGRGHRSHLPPRPYVRPATQRWMMKARDAAVHAFREVTRL